jgi:hypothetical protein
MTNARRGGLPKGQEAKDTLATALKATLSSLEAATTVVEFVDAHMIQAKEDVVADLSKATIKKEKAVATKAAAKATPQARDAASPGLGASNGGTDTADEDESFWGGF